ncbi:hypothetical protein [Jiangella sp. DSM 45060]|uniref:hypothetical protein n=1 Tax=Jiangella sp. DSM 45060 TaxID=1798224 RepID=UPI00087BF0B9|nr:hypothetical protein [Jiangella sp. DSM 45060]SDT54115.1 hypothetical protein SAMN04515669_4648 [Jiangella sp. DSM 45060]
MNTTYVAQLVHEERAGRLRAEADADRLARTARRAARRTAERPARRSGWVVRHLPGRHAV